MGAHLDLRRAFKENGLTFKEVARRMGLSSSNISQYVAGNPTVSRLQDIADAVGVDIRDLFFTDDMENPHSLTEKQEYLLERQKENRSRYDGFFNEVDNQQQNGSQQQNNNQQQNGQNNSGEQSEQDSSSPVDGFFAPGGIVNTGGIQVDEAKFLARGKEELYRAYICPHCGTKFMVLSEAD